MKKMKESDFLNKVKNKNPNIQILEPFVSTSSYIKYKCLKCNYINSTIANHLLRGHGCPKCAHRLKLTQEDYERKMKEINPNLKILGKYTKGCEKIEYVCIKCGYKHKSVASDLLRGVGCPKCSGKIRFTQEEFEKVVKERNDTIQILGKYTGSREKIAYKCLICGYEGNCKASHLLEGQGCPVCCLSKGEKSISKILLKYNIKFIQQKKYLDLIGVNGGQLSYDFYLPSYNLLIEYQGEQHIKSIEYFNGEKGLKIRKEHDRRKKEYARDNNIQLLEIWYNESIEEKLMKTLNLETVETAGN